MAPPRPKFDVPGVIGYECKHVVYSEALDGTPHDLLTIKERLFFEDGHTEDRLSFWGDYKRKFWVTKKEYQNYSDKKEFEERKKCNEFSTTQINMPKSIVQALGYGDPNGGLRKLAQSPYLYGADINTTCILKHNYQQQWPKARSNNTVAVLDLETNMFTEDQYPITGQLSFQDKAILAVDRGWYGASPNADEEIRAAIKKHLYDDSEIGPKIKERIPLENIEIRIVNGPVEIIQTLFERAHQWQPDIIEIWNQDFDVPVIMRVLEDFGVDPKDVLCDPRVPKNFRRCEYKQGIKRKKAASGREVTVKPADQWHMLYCTASFTIICGMCTYRRVRLAGGQDFSYGLDDVVKREVGSKIGKLYVKLPLLEGIEDGSAKWHEIMQTHYRDIYCSYALFDDVVTEILDETIKDISQMLPTLVGISEYSQYNRQPVMLVNDLHFFYLGHGKVIGTGSSSVQTELDDDTLDLTGWIVMLPTYMMVDNGIPVFKDLPELLSYLRAHIADLDVRSSYPNGVLLGNISKDTTERELCGIEGLEELDQRRAGINLMSAQVNAVELCCTLFGVPTLDELLESFKEDHKQ